jgi:hypothetical protein
VEPSLTPLPRAHLKDINIIQTVDVDLSDQDGVGPSRSMTNKDGIICLSVCPKGFIVVYNCKIMQ